MPKLCSCQKKVLDYVHSAYVSHSNSLFSTPVLQLLMPPCWLWCDPLERNRLSPSCCIATPRFFLSCHCQFYQRYRSILSVVFFINSFSGSRTSAVFPLLLFLWVFCWRKSVSVCDELRLVLNDLSPAFRAPYVAWTSERAPRFRAHVGVCQVTAHHGSLQ